MRLIEELFILAVPSSIFVVVLCFHFRVQPLLHYFRSYNTGCIEEHRALQVFIDY